MPTFRPGKPYLLAGIAANQAIGAGSQPVPFTVTKQDGDLTWDGTTFMADVAGFYLICGGANRAAPGSASVFVARLVVNGTTTAVSSLPSNTGQLSTSLSCYRELSIGDTVFLQVVVHSTLGGTLQPNGTYLDVVRLGPVRWT